MVDFDLLLASVKGEEKIALEERLDIVLHKIKFMEPVPVMCLDTALVVNNSFFNYVSIAGGLPMMDPDAAAYHIYMAPGKTLNDLMREVPSQLDTSWNAVQNNRLILLNQDVYDLSNPEIVVGLIEDLAEMLHPGSLIFGHEGDSWVRFGG